MANTKIIVTALVLIVAVPILLGYGLAFQDVEKSGWKSSEDTDVTELLNNTRAWSYFNANSFDMNGRNIYDASGVMTGMGMYPLYQHFQSTPTSLQLKVLTVPLGQTIALASDGSSGSLITSSSVYRPAEIRYTTVAQYPDTVTKNVVSIAWAGVHVYGVERISAGVYAEFDYPLGISITFPDDEVTIETYTSGSYADPSQGWKAGQYSLWYDNGLMWSMNGHDLQTAILTMDLGGIDPSGFDIYGSTSDIEVTIGYTDGNLKINGTTVPSKSSAGALAATGNVWQLVIDSNGARMNYINNWPSSYGPARSFYTMELSDVSQTYKGIGLNSNITYRADLASVKSVSYPAIKDNTYDPQSLINNPEGSWRIELSNTDVAGSSITFGGSTYTVTDKQITVNGKKLDVNGLRLDSVYRDGTRTNTINGIEVSTGTTTVRFGGTWSAIVTQSYLTYETWTDYEWQAGEWAWEGVGADFALIGLLTCGAVFVGLGMYGRRSGAKVGMLMMITGCAALIFLAMI